MKIASVECLPVHSGWRKNFVFVRVETDAGVVGWGEAYSQYDRDPAVAAQVNELGRYLIGRDPFHIRHILQIAFDDYAQRRGSLEFYCATSGIRAGAVGHRRQGHAAAGLQSPRRPLPFAHPRLRERLELQDECARGLCPRRGERAQARFHRAEIRSRPGTVADLRSEGSHPARRESHARRARCRRAGRRHPDRGAPAARADARHRSRQCARGVRALLARGAMSVRERRGVGGCPPRKSNSRDDRRSAADARSVSVRYSAPVPSTSSIPMSRTAAGFSNSCTSRQQPKPRPSRFRHTTTIRRPWRCPPPSMHRPACRISSSPNTSCRSRSSASACVRTRCGLSDGYITLPEGPGLGLHIDESAVRAEKGRQFPARTFRSIEDEGP